MRLFIVVLLILLAPLLTACAPDPSLMTKADERALAMRFFATLERARTTPGDFPVPTDIALKASAYRSIAGEVPSAEPALVGAFRYAGTKGSQATLTYSVEGDGQFRLVSFIMMRPGGQPRLVHTNLTRLDQPYAEVKRFKLDGQPLGSLLLLLLPVASLLIAVVAILRVWRSERFGWRWLWTIGCLLGIGQFIILWPTGRVLFQPLYVSILPAGLRQIGPLPDSWLVSAAAPIVALIVLVIRRGHFTPTAADEPPSAAH